MEFLRNTYKIVDVDVDDMASPSPASQNTIDTTKQTAYNYYPMFSTKINTQYTGNIQYSLNGKENEPNVTVTENFDSIGYVSKNLFIFSKIHHFPQMENFEGELIVENVPISKSNKPLYLCVPLKTNSSAPKNTIDKIVENDDTNIDINLNTVLPLEEISYYYETADYKYLVFHKPIDVKTNFVGFNKGSKDDLFIPPKNVSMIRASSDVVHMKKNTVGTGGTSRWWGTPSPSGQKHVTEGFEPNEYFECDNVDISYNNDIPTYTIPAGSNNISLKEKTLNVAITMVWLLCIVAVVFMVTPMLFRMLAVSSIIDPSNAPESLTNINKVEATLSFLLFIPAIILVSVGASTSAKCTDGDNDCMQKANNLILPGTILLGVWVFFLASLAWSKYINPNFLGFADISKNVAYYQYKPTDIGFGHLLNIFAPFSVISTIVKNVANRFAS
jgi:hypothetical protein